MRLKGHICKHNDQKNLKTTKYSQEFSRRDSHSCVICKIEGLKSLFFLTFKFSPEDMFIDFKEEGREREGVKSKTSM